jgi:hypothetical protein
MNIIISESQFKMLCEQHAFAAQGVPDWYRKSVDDFTKTYPNLSNLIGDLALWMVPYIGPYLVSAKNTTEGILLYKKGKKVEGVISILTSPLALMKVVKILKYLGTTGNVVDMLNLINKSGIPILVNKGQEAFLNWGWKQFGKDFKIFVEFLKNQKHTKPILDDIVKSL